MLSGQELSELMMNAIACALVAVVFCSVVAAGQRQEEQTIRKVDVAWSHALQSKDLDKILSNYAEDASFLPPDEPIVRGRENIRQWFARRVAMPGYSARFTPTKIFVAKSGDMAYELGTFRVTLDDGSGKPVEYSGKHLVTWEKVCGRWKVAAESINRDAPRAR